MSNTTYYDKPEDIIVGGNAKTLANISKRIQPLVTEKKEALTINSNGKQTDYRLLYKLETQADGDGKVELNRVNHEYSQKIIHARIKAKLTRKQLAQQLSEKEATIADYENGKAIKDTKVMNKLNKFIEKNK